MTRRPADPCPGRNEPPPPRAIRTGQVWAVLGLILALGGGIYFQVHAHAFVDYDDIGYFVNDPRLDGRLTGDDLVSAFAEPYFANWSPMTSLSIRVGDALHGADPGAHLLTNVMLHLLASMGLFLALVKMTRQIGPSAFVGLVFAVHPLHVESVAWASERKDVLAAAFWMTGLLAYAFYTAKRSRPLYATVIVLGGLAMLSKPTAVSFPITLLLLDFWPSNTLVNGRALRQRVAEKVPLILMAGLLAGATFWVQDDAGARQTEWLSFFDRGMNAGLSYATYIADTFWPVDLAVFYPYPNPERLGSLWPLGAWGALAVLSALCLYRAPQRPYLLMGWAWFGVTLVPMIGFIQVGTQGHADRYMYVPMIGLLIAVAWGLSSVFAALRAPRWLGPLLAAGVLLALSMASYRQAGHWRNTLQLFSHALEATGANPVAHRGLGVTYWLEGETALGEEHLRMAVQLDPRWPDARLALALALNQSGRFEEAEQHFLQAREDGADPGRVHAGLGVGAQQMGQDTRAATEYQAALALRPDEWEIVNNLAWLLATTGDIGLRDSARAVVLAQSAVSAVPGNVDFLETLATAYAALGHYPEAQESQQRALSALPGNTDPADPSTKTRLQGQLRIYENRGSDE
ncbi:MAG TPA: tetratricopeptide repeat protein [Myxococcales bacterium]|nr:tetratricopeptide repeat protein [Myxococcales bacterium]